MEESIKEKNILESYYISKSEKAQKNINNPNQLIVSTRIREVINDSSFSFHPLFLKSIHSYLFTGIFDNAGIYRDYNLTKKEFILNNESVAYAPFDRIEAYLTYDFNEERKHQYRYRNQTLEEIIKSLVSFNSNIWETHPFADGNTRTTEVFMVKYLRYLGYSLDNNLYKNNSLYFRNALVRSCYSNDSLRINSDNQYLIRFYQNLLMGTNYPLQSRDLIVSELYCSKPKIRERKL